MFRKKQSSDSDEALSSDILSDAKYREELKAVGRKHFKDLIDRQSEYLDKEVNEMMERVGADMKGYASRRVDMLMGRLNAEITNQLNDRIQEYNRVSSEAQELVAQSLSRNAQMVHEKYQQLSLDLQRTIANQEVQMATLFQDSKTQVATVQSEQHKILEQLRETEQAARRDTEELGRSLRESAEEQSSKLDEVYKENITRVESTREAQSGMLENLTRSTKALESQYAQLTELLNDSISKQKEMVAETINDNMARIVEHYIIGALGEQSSLREQLPSIIEHMEENKQAMVDDMKL